MSRNRFNDRQVATWVGNVVGKQFKTWGKLTDGVALCEFANVVIPGFVRNITSGRLGMEKKQNIDNFIRFLNEIGVEPVFPAQSMSSFAQRDRIVGTFVALNDVLKTQGSFSGPFLEDANAAPRSTGPVLTLLEQRQQEVGERVSRAGLGSHNVIKNVDELRAMHPNRKYVEDD